MKKSIDYLKAYLNVDNFLPLGPGSNDIKIYSKNRFLSVKGFCSFFIMMFFINISLFAQQTGCSSGAFICVNAPSAATSITFSSANTTLTITYSNQYLSQYGILWSTSPSPTVGSTPGGSNSFINPPAGTVTTTAAVLFSMTGLSPSTTYYVRGYGTSPLGTGYSADMSFTTPAVTPFTITTDIPSSVTSATAITGGNITQNMAVTAASRGTAYGTASNPVAPGTTNGSGNGAYTVNLTGLISNTNYFARSYVVGSDGITYYGPQVTFSTLFAGNLAVAISPKWRFGNRAGLNFSGGVATPTPASQNLANASPEASASVCDTTDAIIFYTDTRVVYNVSAAIRDLEANDNIAAGSATQGAMAIPDPASPYDTYYLFSANDFSGGSRERKGINYWKFKKTAGVVSYLSGPTNLIGDAAVSGIVDESIMAVPDGAGGYWLLSHSQSTTDFYVWRVTSSGISAPTIYPATGTASPAGAAAQSCIRVNWCLNKVAWGRGTQVRVHSFNQTTGAITAAPIYAGGAAYLAAKSVYHVEFSPDGNKLYVSSMNYNQLVQVDLNGAAGNGTPISTNEIWGLQLGPNGNLYASGVPLSDQYYEITSPNSSSPTITSKALAAGTTVYRGISNLPLIGGTASGASNNINAGYKLKKVPTNCRDYMFGFKYYNYNNDPITITGATYTFTSKVAPFTVTTVVAPAPYTDSINYILPANNAYDVTVTVTDAFCGLPHVSNVFTVTPNCPAPVQFINISAVSQVGSTKVFWSTAMEINSAAFAIQRCTNGKDFTTVGSVQAAGNSSHIKNYSFTDEKPLDGKVYYRVVETDTDGRKIYSSIVSTNSESDGKIYTISNNPFKNEFSLNIIGEQNIFINIFDGSGKSVYVNKLENASGSIALGADLSSGAYILEIVDNATGRAYRDKLIKY